MTLSSTDTDCDARNDSSLKLTRELDCSLRRIIDDQITGRERQGNLQNLTVAEA